MTPAVTPSDSQPFPPSHSSHLTDRLASLEWLHKAEVSFQIVEARVSLRLNLEIVVIRFRVKRRSGVILPLHGSFPSLGHGQGCGCPGGERVWHCRGAINRVMAMIMRCFSPVLGQHQPHRWHTQLTVRSQGCWRCAVWAHFLPCYPHLLPPSLHLSCPPHYISYVLSK